LFFDQASGTPNAKRKKSKRWQSTHNKWVAIRIDVSATAVRESNQERETDCHQVAIAGVRNSVDDLKISARVRPLLKSSLIGWFFLCPQKSPEPVGAFSFSASD
jgi:hypothetical protein